MKAYIGIDIGKVSVAALCPPDSQKAHKSTFSFQTKLLHFEQLLAWVRSQGITQPFFLLEPSGVYWIPLYSWLVSNDIEVCLVFPQTVRYSAKLDNKRTKNDAQDARTLAEYGARYKPTSQASRLDFFEVREAARHHSMLTQETTRYKNRLKRHLAVVFPEFCEVFKDPSRQTALAILERYPTPGDIVEAGVEKIADIRARQRRVGEKRALQLVQRAQESVGLEANSSIFALRLRGLVSMLKALEGQKREVESWIEENYKSEALEILTSIPGCGTSAATRILVEIGDPHRFSNANKIVAYAGLNPREVNTGNEGRKRRKGSGEEGKSWRMSKQGNSRLRHMLYLVALQAVQRDEGLRSFYQKKLRGGNGHAAKKPKVALGHCMKKLLVVMWTLLKKNERYDSDKIRVAA